MSDFHSGSFILSAPSMPGKVLSMLTVSSAPPVSPAGTQHKAIHVASCKLQPLGSSKGTSSVVPLRRCGGCALVIAAEGSQCSAE